MLRSVVRHTNEVPMFREIERCVLLDLYWEGMYLHLVISNRSGKELFLRSKRRPLIPLKEIEVSRNGATQKEVVFNITAVHERAFLENGKWEIGQYATDELPKEEFRYKPEKDDTYEDFFCFCVVSPELADKLQNLDRVLRYNGLKYAYTVNFSVYTIDEETMHLNIVSLFMRENDRYAKRRYFFEAPSFKEGVKKFLTAIKREIIKGSYVVFHKLRHIDIGHKNVLLFTEVQESIGGNLLALYSKLCELHLDERFSIEVSARQAVGRRNTLWSWFSVIKKLAWADYIFVDNYVPLFNDLILPERTQVIQLWHAGVGFKSVGYSRFGKTGSPHPVRHAHRKYTKALAPSEKLIPVYAELFGIEEKAFIPTGLPRFDAFFDQEKVQIFKKKFYQDHPGLKDKKIILFAPTFRGEGQKTAYYNYCKLDFKRIAEFCGDEYVFALKMHPFIQTDTQAYYNKRLAQDPGLSPEAQQHLLECLKPDLAPYEGKIIDLTSSYDINDLFHVAAILITDYSSAYYEFSIQKRPILFYTYDRQIYENVRGVHQRIKNFAPGKVCDTFDELLEALRREDYDLDKTIKFADENFPEDSTHKGEATVRLIEATLLTEEAPMVKK